MQINKKSFKGAESEETKKKKRSYSMAKKNFLAKSSIDKHPIFVCAHATLGRP